MKGIELMIVKITWDFSDTEFDGVGHRVTVDNLGLPLEIDTDCIELDEEIEICEEDVKDYLYENYSFEVKKLKFLD